MENFSFEFLELLEDLFGFELESTFMNMFTFTNINKEYDLIIDMEDNSFSDELLDKELIDFLVGYGFNTKKGDNSMDNKNSFTLDVNGTLYDIEKPYDLYEIYNDFLIDHDAEIYDLGGDLEIVETVRDFYNVVYDIIIENGFSYITYTELEEIAANL